MPRVAVGDDAITEQHEHLAGGGEEVR